MAIETRSIVYDGPGGPFEGVVAYDTAATGPRPGVMVSHNWLGQDDFDTGKATMLAELGYVGFAIDNYGQGKRGSNVEEATALMTELASDRKILQARLNNSLSVLKSLPEVDASKTAAIGFCLGGKCVLDLARSGADTLGVLSFHGLYDAPEFANAKITAKVAICDGYEDPLCPPDAKLAIMKELNDAGVDWQFHSFGHTGHSFTDPNANMRENGMWHQPDTARRSMKIMTDFLAELFA